MRVGVLFERDTHVAPTQPTIRFKWHMYHRAGLLPLAPTNANEERDAGGGPAALPGADMAWIRLVAGAGGWRSRPVQRGRPGSARRARTGEPHSHKDARGGRRHPRYSDKTKLLN